LSRSLRYSTDANALGRLVSAGRLVATGGVLIRARLSEQLLSVFHRHLLFPSGGLLGNQTVLMISAWPGNAIWLPFWSIVVMITNYGLRITQEGVQQIEAIRLSYRLVHRASRSYRSFARLPECSPSYEYRLS
jgi:hypothetical protein